MTSTFCAHHQWHSLFVTEEDPRSKEFDFLINGELLRGALENHIAERSIPVVSEVA